MIVIFFNQKRFIPDFIEKGFQALSRRFFSYFDEGKSSVIAKEARLARRALIFIGETGECNFCHSQQGYVVERRLNGAQWLQMAKIRQKLDKQIREIDPSFMFSPQFNNF